MLILTAGLLIHDSKRDGFADLYSIRAMKEPNIGVSKSKYYQRITEDYFPNTKMTEVNDVRQFLKGKHPEVDALIFSAEVASAWSMLYPEFSAIIPKGLKLKGPIALILPKDQGDYVNFINTWLQLKQDSGFQQKVYDYWILGKNPKAKQPRWSVMKDVLGWL